MFKVFLGSYFGGAKESVAAALAAMRPRRRGAFADERLAQQVCRLAGVFLAQLPAGLSL